MEISISNQPESISRIFRILLLQVLPVVLTAVYFQSHREKYITYQIIYTRSVAV